MLKDKLNRKLYVGDLIFHDSKYCLILSSNSYLNEDFNLVFLNESETVICYLIQNPNRDELSIKSALTEHLKSYNHELGLCLYSVGDIIGGSDGFYYLYLGQISLKSPTRDGNNYSIYGHGYLYLPTHLLKRSSHVKLSYLYELLNEKDVVVSLENPNCSHSNIEVTLNKVISYTEFIPSNLDLSFLDNLVINKVVMFNTGTKKRPDDRIKLRLNLLDR